MSYDFGNIVCCYDVVFFVLVDQREDNLARLASRLDVKVDHVVPQVIRPLFLVDFVFRNEAQVCLNFDEGFDW